MELDLKGGATGKRLPKRKRCWENFQLENPPRGERALFLGRAKGKPQENSKTRE